MLVIVLVYQTEKGGKSYRKKVLEEHITLAVEPGSQYIGHYSLKTGSVKGITKGLFEYAEENKTDVKELIEIGCDRTVANTGEKGVAIRLIEMKLDRAVHHFNCQLHANELSLRHLVENLVGKTYGPRGFTGPIGKQLQSCRDNPIIQFERIHAEIPTIDYKDVSTDQECLFEIHQATSQGFCPSDPVHCNLGKMAHSLWVTTGNRLL